jgi:DNA-binding Lrp family transcriptional regulator
MTQIKKITKEVQKAARKVQAPNRRAAGVKISQDAVAQIVKTIRENDKAITFLAKV